MTALAKVTPQSFGLGIAGPYSYRIQDNRVLLTIAEIANNRAFDNLSGTLAVELRGYRNDGEQSLLASTTIGQISGQHFLPNCEYDLIFNAPSAGQWQLALELREWDGVHYALVEQLPFAHHYVVEAAPQIAVAKEGNVIVGRFQSTTTEPVSATPVQAKQASQPVEKANEKAAEKANDKTAEKVLPSINQSTLDELSTVKGLPKRVAKEIVEKRPHDTWDALLKIKGIGPKLLKKLSKVLNLN